jgi:hypothetical protein
MMARVSARFIAYTLHGSCQRLCRADGGLPAIAALAPGKRIYGNNGGNPNMNVSLSIGPVISLIAGILILIVPRLLNYIVAVYLILIGLVGLMGSGYFRLH